MPVLYKDVRAKYVSDEPMDEVAFVLMHHTAGGFPGDFNTLAGVTGSRVSAHYYIREDGAAWELVPPPKKAWHAGESEWVLDGRRYSGMNRYAIGIELSNLDGNTHPYPQAQINALLWLAKEVILTSWPALKDSRRWIGHQDVSPGRKIDPGKLFPWDVVRREIEGTGDLEVFNAFKALYERHPESAKELNTIRRRVKLSMDK